MSRNSESFANQAQKDLSFLGPALLNPLRELHHFSFQKHRALIALAAIGLTPLTIMYALHNGLDMLGAYWALALYFSLFWLVCFIGFFRGDSTIHTREIAICYFGTSVFTVVIYLPLTAYPPISFGAHLLQADIFLPLKEILVCLFIGLPEEFCKSVALFMLWKMGASTTPRTMLIYGLMCGLGFGIREGVLYQTGANIMSSQGDMSVYYLMNIIRLTTLPFLHAIWTGIAGYFIGFAQLYPQRRVGFVIVALGLPALLHGTYDTLAGSFLGLVIGLLSVVILGLYLNATEDLQAKLENERGLSGPGPA